VSTPSGALSNAALRRRAAPLACALLAALGVAACGSRGPHHFANAEAAASSGLYVDAGPITYQVQISRQLNQYSTEDHQYLLGLPKSVKPPAPDELWFAVFLKAFNQTRHPAIASDDFTITDSQGTTYHPIALDTSVNPLAWVSKVLPPGATEPAPDSVADDDPEQGSELLFKLNNSIYANRPLTLHIYPQTGQSAMVQLDL
jgi:predicted small lipoprotein YifL